MLVSLATLDGAQIDPAEQQRQVIARDFRTLLALVLRLQIGGKLKRPFLQTLVPDGQAIAVPIQDLESIPVAIAKHESLRNLATYSNLAMPSVPFEGVLVAGMIFQNDIQLKDVNARVGRYANPPALWMPLADRVRSRQRCTQSITPGVAIDDHRRP